jgi:succinate dehydrogenase flavin-adding protein (antitoxin of CptAB toxin-antitoxin module)
MKDGGEKMLAMNDENRKKQQWRCQKGKLETP